MTLSENQIQELYKFTRNRFVEHYDLQTEIVDHLANGIEEQWQENPRLTLIEAKQIEFKKFGHFGFRSIIKKRKKAMSKRYWKLITSFYKAYFRLPKIIILFGFSLLLFLSLRIINPSYKMIGLSLLFLTVGIYFIFRAKKNRDYYEVKIVKNQRRWMLEEKIYNVGEWAQMAIFPMYIFNLFFDPKYAIENIYLDAILSFATVCYLTLSYIMVFVIPAKAEELLEETYPEYKMV